MAKCDVNGENALESYKFLRYGSTLYGGEISWNFEKFLLDKSGQVLKHYGPQVQLEDIREDIENVLLDEINKESNFTATPKIKQKL